MIVSYFADLEATKTHKRRWYHLCAPAGEWLYRVTIGQGRDTDVYFLDEFPDEMLKAGVRCVWFSRMTGQVTEDRPPIYRVVIDPFGNVLNCTCKGSTCSQQFNPCKHRDVLVDMLSKGLLPAAAVGVGV